MKNYIKLILFSILSFGFLAFFLFSSGPYHDGSYDKDAPIAIEASVKQPIQKIQNTARPIPYEVLPERGVPERSSSGSTKADQKQVVTAGGRLINSDMQADLRNSANPWGIKLQEGVEYSSDYNISNITIDDAAEQREARAKGHTNVYFSYMNPLTATHKFLWVSNKPRIAYVPEFLTDEECDAIIEFSSKRITRSRLVTRKPGDSDIDETRTSSQTWISHGGLPQADSVYKKIGELTGWPSTGAFSNSSHYSELLQVLHYDEGQKYNDHYDSQLPELHGAQRDNRAVTVFMYLTTVPQGGVTVFPYADGHWIPPKDWKIWDKGLRIHPQKRAAVIFYDMTPDGAFDKFAMHGGAPPLHGEVKWGATQWLRVKSSDYFPARYREGWPWPAPVVNRTNR